MFVIISKGQRCWTFCNVTTPVMNGVFQLSTGVCAILEYITLTNLSTLGVYGFIDTFSRKILALSVVVSNSDPLVIGQLYTFVVQVENGSKVLENG